MNRKNCLFNQICDFENIRNAYLKARRGKSKTLAVKGFNQNVNKNLEKIRCNFLNEDFEWGSYRQFKIYDPKERLISCVNFEQRIMHHAIMNVLEPVFERQFIYHTYASRKNKGVHLAVKYACNNCLKYDYYLKLDVGKYFDSIDHNLLKGKLFRIIKDKDCLKLLNSIIDSYHSDTGKGLPIGNLTSQFFANYYLSEFDHILLEIFFLEYGIPKHAYCRYMDDMIIWADSRESLKRLFHKIKEFFEVNLLLHLKEPVFGKCIEGLAFLGWKMNGRQIILLKKNRLRRMKTIENINKLYSKGLINEIEAFGRLPQMEFPEKFL